MGEFFAFLWKFEKCNFSTLNYIENVVFTPKNVLKNVKIAFLSGKRHFSLRRGRFPRYPARGNVFCRFRPRNVCGNGHKTKRAAQWYSGQSPDSGGSLEPVARWCRVHGAHGWVTVRTIGELHATRLYLLIRGGLRWFESGLHQATRCVWKSRI